MKKRDRTILLIIISSMLILMIFSCTPDPTLIEHEADDPSPIIGNWAGILTINGNRTRFDSTVEADGSLTGRYSGKTITGTWGFDSNDYLYLTAENGVPYGPINIELSDTYMHLTYTYLLWEMEYDGYRVNGP